MCYRPIQHPPLHTLTKNDNYNDADVSVHIREQQHPANCGTEHASERWWMLTTCFCCLLHREISRKPTGYGFTRFQVERIQHSVPRVFLFFENRLYPSFLMQLSYVCVCVYVYVCVCLFLKYLCGSGSGWPESFNMAAVWFKSVQRQICLDYNDIVNKLFHKCFTNSASTVHQSHHSHVCTRANHCRAHFHDIP